MKKLVVNLNDGSFINIPADRMKIDENIIIATSGGEVVAVLDVTAVVVAYISGTVETK